MADYSARARRLRRYIRIYQQAQQPSITVKPDQTPDAYTPGTNSLPQYAGHISIAVHHQSPISSRCAWRWPSAPGPSTAATAAAALLEPLQRILKVSRVRRRHIRRRISTSRSSTLILTAGVASAAAARLPVLGRVAECSAWHVEWAEEWG